MVSIEMWTIENELMRLSKMPTADDALVALGLNQSREALTIELMEPWRRGGAETYICKFAICRQGGSTQEFLIKACVAHRFGGTLHEVLDEWIARRVMIAAAGVKTPRLVCATEGVILEEYVPYSLSSALMAADGIVRGRLLRDLGHFAGTLERLRFAPIAPFSDLRTDGANIFCIDFGEDLGPPNREALTRGNLKLLQEYLKLSEIFPSDSENMTITRAHELALTAV